MRRFLLLAPLILALSSPVFAGLPSSRTNKWVRTGPNFSIDTEDVNLNRSKIRFYVRRNAVKGEYAGAGPLNVWAGKMRVDCKKFTTMTELEATDPLGIFTPQTSWKSIKPGEYQYLLANYFCFLTGVEGYTREGGQERIGFGASLYKKPDTEQVTIHSVVNDSPAGKSGFMKGDVIISINGKSALGMDDAEVFKEIGKEEGKKVSMVIQRKIESGKSKELNLNFTTGKFLTDEPDWVKKIINTVQSKPVQKSNSANVKCDSAAWRNKPQCRDY